MVASPWLYNFTRLASPVMTTCISLEAVKWAEKRYIKWSKARITEKLNIALRKVFSSTVELFCIVWSHLWPSILPTHCYHLWLPLISIYDNVPSEWEAIDVMVSNSRLKRISLSWTRGLLTFHDWYTFFPLYFHENLLNWTQFEMLGHAILILQACDFPREDPEIRRMWD